MGCYRNEQEEDRRIELRYAKFRIGCKPLATYRSIKIIYLY